MENVQLWYKFKCTCTLFSTVGKPCNDSTCTLFSTVGKPCNASIKVRKKVTCPRFRVKKY